MPDTVTDVHYSDFMILLEGIRRNLQAQTMILIALAQAQGVPLPAEVLAAAAGGDTHA